MTKLNVQGPCTLLDLTRNIIMVYRFLDFRNQGRGVESREAEGKGAEGRGAEGEGV